MLQGRSASMPWPGDLTIAKRSARIGPLGKFFYGLVGLSAAKASDVNEREFRRIRAKQIDAVTRLVPVTMTINLANVAIVLFVFWNTGSNIFLALWALAITCAAAMATRSWARSRRRPPQEASRNATRRMTIQAFVLALSWGALPVMLLPVIGPTHQLIVACLMAGMISAGGFALSTVPSAGLAYTWTMTCASVLALLLCRVELFAVTGVFLLIYAVFISRNVVSNGNLFFDNQLAQLQLERQTETISLLLKEFQENASDWLWQTDADGRLTHVPERFVEVTQMPAQLLLGAKFVEAMEMLCPSDGAAVAGLAGLMEKHELLRDVVVHVVVGGKARLGRPPVLPTTTTCGLSRRRRHERRHREAVRAFPSTRQGRQRPRHRKGKASPWLRRTWRRAAIGPASASLRRNVRGHGSAFRPHRSAKASRWRFPEIP